MDCIQGRGAFVSLVETQEPRASVKLLENASLVGLLVQLPGRFLLRITVCGLITSPRPRLASPVQL